MPSRLQRQCFLIKYLNTSNNKTRKRLVPHTEKDFIDCLRDGCLNILKDTVVLSRKDLTRLKRYKNSIRKAANKRYSTKAVRKILIKGGFLNVLIPILAGIADSITR